MRQLNGNELGGVMLGTIVLAFLSWTISFSVVIGAFVALVSGLAVSVVLGGVKIDQCRSVA